MTTVKGESLMFTGKLIKISGYGNAKCLIFAVTNRTLAATVIGGHYVINRSYRVSLRDCDRDQTPEIEHITEVKSKRDLNQMFWAGVAVDNAYQEKIAAKYQR